MIERHIEGILRNVSQSLNRLSLYGAELQVVSMRPEGAARWRWEVTPKWRRSRSGGMVPYQEVANGAQVKVFAIQLVLAALLADTDTVGRVLILDELGNSLGEVNRKESWGTFMRWPNASRSPSSEPVKTRCFRMPPTTSASSFGSRTP
jgi:hypothetical protein